MACFQNRVRALTDEHVPSDSYNRRTHVIRDVQLRKPSMDDVDGSRGEFDGNRRQSGAGRPTQLHCTYKEYNHVMLPC